MIRCLSPGLCRTFLSRFIPVTLAILAVFTGMMWEARRDLLHRHEGRAKAAVAAETAAMDATLATHIRDVVFLAQLLQQDLREGGKVGSEHGRGEMELFIRIRTNFDHVRYIARSGKEILRVNRTPEGARIVPEAELQDKSGRPYFQKGMALAGNVLISRLDLNQERGRIEKPLKPVIRIVAPVRVGEGPPQGIVVANYLAAEILERMRTAFKDENQRLLLLNEGGYYLLGPSPEDEWGFVLPEAAASSLPAQHPDAWKVIRAAPEGQFLGEKGLFTFGTIRPGRLVHGGGDIEVDAMEEWKLVSFVERGRLAPPWRAWAFLGMAGLLILIAALIWQWAKSQGKREEVLRDLRERDERLRAITDVVQDSITVINADDDILFWSGSAERMFGYSRKEALGRKLHELVSGETDRKAAYHGMKSFKKSGTGPIVGKLLEVQAHRKNGEVFPAELAVSALKTSEGWLAVGALRDITERKDIEKELHAHRERLEDLVGERTGELETANKKLEEQVDILAQAREAVKQESEYNKMLVETSPAFFVAIGADGKVRMMNKVLLDALGWKREEALGADYLSTFIPEFDRAALEETFKTLTDAKKPTHNESHIQTKAGGLILVEWHGRPILRPTGELDFFFGVGMDITERNRMERSLKLDEGRLARLVKLHQSPAGTEEELARLAIEDAVSLVGAEVGYLRLLSADAKTVRFCCENRKAAEDNRAKKPMEESVEAGGAWAEAVRRREAVIHNDCGKVHGFRGFPKGHIPLRRHLGVPFFDGEDIVGVVGVANRERPFEQADADQLALFFSGVWALLKEKRGQEALYQAQEQMRKLTRAVEQSPVTVVITDAEGKIEYVNPIFIELTGYSREEAIGQNPRILKSEKQSKEFYKEMWEILSAGKDWRGEFCNKKKNGELYWESASISPVKDAAGVITHFISVKEDITERRKMEGELRAAKEAAVDASRAKSAFLASMSHELRTPLNSIIGFSEVLYDKTFGKLNKKQEVYVDSILGSGRHLLALINDILDLSKVESGKMELELSPVRIKPLLEGCLTMVQEKAMRHAIDLKLDLPEELADFEFEADERKLKQILFNLLSNAGKFTPDGGRIRVAGAKKNGDLVISVEDTGIGIKPEDQDRIFQEFEQADSSYAKAKQGTGLGLALTRKFVELHGGRIWLESEGKNKGSRFSFSIPVERKNDA